MNQNIFQVEYEGNFKTVRTCNDGLGVVRRMLKGFDRASWVKVDKNKTLYHGTNGIATVTRLDHVSLACI